MVYILISLKINERGFMAQNESSVDRGVRIILGLVALWIGSSILKNDIWGIVVDVISLILLITGMIGFCPLYKLFRIDTTKSNKK
jgi:hypothetical protein